VSLHVFSSGSVRNQQDWFTFAWGGELASLITGWFDLTTAGVKPESLSCRTISEVIGAHRPGEPNSPRVHRTGGSVFCRYRTGATVVARRFSNSG
jgi:hypothetical protein